MTCFADLRKQIVEAVALAGVQARRRLIHDKKLGTTQQSLRDTKTLPHASGIAGREFLSIIVEIAAPQHCFHKFLALFAIHDSFQKGDVIQHVLRGNARVNAEVLRQIAKPAANFFLLLQHVDVTKRCGSAVRLLERGQRAHQRGLAGTIGAKQSVHPARNPQRDVIQCFHTIRIGFGQTLNIEFHGGLQEYSYERFA